MGADVTHSAKSEGLPAPERADPRGVTHRPPDPARRRVLVAVTTAVGGIGIAAAAMPFIGSMLPIERAKAAGALVETDISNLEPGMVLTLEWQGKPVWIVCRTDICCRCLEKMTSGWVIPNRMYPSSPHTSEIGRAPLSCSTSFRSGSARTWAARRTFSRKLHLPTWAPNGTAVSYCACHGSKFDLAERVYKGVPAPTILVIPPHG